LPSRLGVRKLDLLEISCCTLDRVRVDRVAILQSVEAPHNKALEATF